MGFANGEVSSIMTQFNRATVETSTDVRATAKFPASAAFDAINSALTGSEADRKDAIKQGNGVYAFTLKNKAGETESWHIDLKEKGAVGTGLGNKPNVTLSLSDDDFAKLVAGQANAQRLFMSGKLKIKGDVMKATKLDPILKKSQTKAKL
ncbi:sterol-binding-like protein [Nemania serpens]|nr:sterol-binding-like protein [Nemania serpens]